MKVNLDTLKLGLMGLTKEFGNFLHQACSVCLDNQKHQSGVKMNLKTSKLEKSIQLIWNSEINSQILRNWNDLQEATEYAATGIAIKLAELESDSTCIERSSKGSGFDYWLGEEVETGLFQKKEVLEISGILQESPSNSLKSRISSKKKQITNALKLHHKAHVCVIEFANPKGEYLKYDCQETT
ncbi:MAG TPA: hypothetical protein ENJ27_02420 [Candidatus Moranbacteria bacterium]|nr:hypothetical protein [Candidatus Moranbacteria bacterium]